MSFYDDDLIDLWTLNITDMGNQTYTINDVYDVDHFIDLFPSKTGIDFKYVHLYIDDICLTKSRKFMIDNFKNGMNLTMLIHDKPIRILENDVIWRNIDPLNFYNEPHVSINIEKMIEIYGEIEKWDVSFIQNMENFFYYCSDFNYNINEWDVSSVTNMAYMFNNCTYFNQPLNKWDVSNVKYMNYMFNNCTYFNQPLNNWNVSNVQDMFSMFYNCSSFNQPLNNWNVSNTTDIQYMLEQCYRFNSPLFNHKHLNH